MWEWLIMREWVMGRNITITGKVKDGDETSPANDRNRCGSADISMMGSA